jgi:DNA-binding CsgD family transcriptional regulator
MAQPAQQIVGRAAELGSLEETLAELSRGRFAALALVGEPGIGKTRLLAELGARADERGHVVLSGGASELEHEQPFWMFVDAFDEYLEGLEPRRLDAVDEETRAELGQLLPSLAASEAGAELPDGRYRTHRAVRQLLAALAAAKPLVLLLDDVHWADSGSIDLLGSLLRRPPTAPVLIAMAARRRQMPERLAWALERAHRGGALTRVELGSLSRDDARELLGASADELYEESGGNPFYLEQLARFPDARTVAAAMTEELSLLPSDVRRVLEGAAVAGDPFELELAEAAAGLRAGSAIDALDELLRRDLVRHTDVPRRFRFRHPLVRRAVYEAAPGGWRLTAHERCADALAARGAPAAARAHHIERSARHGDLDAVAVLREAGEAAAQRAPATAARLFEAALRLAPPGEERVELLAAAANAHASAGQFREAYAALLESLELLPRDAVALRMKLTAGCAGLENLLGHHQEAHTRLLTALESLSDATSPEAAGLMIELAVDGFYRMDYGSMSEWAGRAVDVARPTADRPLIASAAGVLVLAEVFRGAVPQAEAVRAEAASLVDSMPDDEIARCLDRGVDTLAAAELYLDRFDHAGARAARALGVARATGQGQVLPILFWSAMIRTMRGELADAAKLAEEAIEVARLSGHAEGQAWNLFARSLTATAEGDVETALATAEEAMEALSGLHRSLPLAWSALALAAARLAAGDPERAAHALLDGAGGEELTLLAAPLRATGFELLARCRLALGDRGGAERAAAHAERLAEALELRMPAALAKRAAAAVALDGGDPASAAELALASAALADEVGAVIDAARSRTLAGRALVQLGDLERAVPELERAAAAFDACGALARRDEAERELGKLGRRRHRRTRRGNVDGTGIATLTERELQVSRLIVDRKTNPEIAAALFLSPKTVETHIRNVFHKLGVSSRVEIARAIERDVSRS